MIAFTDDLASLERRRFDWAVRRLAGALQKRLASSKGTQPMIRKFVLAASLLAATSPAFAAGMMIYGHGNTTCAEYNTMPEHGRNMVDHWIDGFFTALSLVAAEEGYDDGSPQKPLVIIAAVATYCVENPSKKVSSAAWYTANSYRGQRLCRGEGKAAKLTEQGWVCTD